MRRQALRAAMAMAVVVCLLCLAGPAGANDTARPGEGVLRAADSAAGTITVRNRSYRVVSETEIRDPEGRLLDPSQLYDRSGDRVRYVYRSASPLAVLVEVVVQDPEAER
ncbi:MAG: hypothetical protein VCB78_07550 [Myxococcota bacterium]